MSNSELSRAPRPSQLYLPKLARPPATIFEYLVIRFPYLGREALAARIAQGEIFLTDGTPITLTTPYQYGIKVFYYRQNAAEAEIPAQERIIFENEEIIVVDKPHLLPVTPAGKYVNQCLLSRLIRRYAGTPFTPVHRLDRETAGLVIFARNVHTRHHYHRLFQEGRVLREYLAVCHVQGQPSQREWRVAGRIAAGEPWYRMKIVPGVVNAITRIQLLELKEGRGLFRLWPETGKKHQLRLHLGALGFNIVNDTLYPELSSSDDRRALQLLAARLSFRDPITGCDFDFTSEQRLEF